MRRLPATLLCILALSTTALLSCGDDGAGTVSLEQFPQRMAQIVCDRAERCCNEEELQTALDDIEVDSLDECATKAQDEFTSNFERLAAAADAGRIRYDPDLMAECLRLIEEASCDSGLTPEFDETPASCEAAMGPLVEVDGACAQSLECKVGRCVGVDRDDEGEVTTLGTCQELGSVGDPCEYSHDCKTENYCNAEDTCEARGQEGAPCGYADCVEGLYCNHRAEQTDPDTGQTRGTCQPPAQPGEPCGDGNYGCASEDTYCDTWSTDDHEPTYTCVPRGELGDPCYSLFDQCRDGAFCDRDGTGTCMAAKAGGEACEGNNECLSGNCTREGTCKPDTSNICMG